MAYPLVGRAILYPLRVLLCLRPCKLLPNDKKRLHREAHHEVCSCRSVLVLASAACDPLTPSGLHLFKLTFDLLGVCLQIWCDVGFVHDLHVGNGVLEFQLVLPPLDDQWLDGAFSIVDIWEETFISYLRGMSMVEALLTVEVVKPGLRRLVSYSKLLFSVPRDEVL